MQRRKPRKRYGNDPETTLDGKLRHLRFEPTDLEICKLFSPIREPWGYEYLPTRYVAPLLARGKEVRDRVRRLSERPHCFLRKPPQPHNIFRQDIWALDTNGATKLREFGYDVPPPKPKRLEHELMRCLIAASYEIAAREYKRPIVLTHDRHKELNPDLPTFRLGASPILYNEADTGSMRIRHRSKKADAILANSIDRKLINYLALLVYGALKDALVIFFTINETRARSMVQCLREIIDEHDRDAGFAYGTSHDLADCFKFTWFEYDRFVNSIIPASSWVMTAKYLEAGSKDPVSLLPERR